MHLAVAFLKSAFTKIVSVQLFWRKEEAIGFTRFLYAKQDMSNINSQELAGFREIAKHYAFLTKAQLTAMINTKELTEICYDCKN